jgi:peptidoglycan/LPS O-acetylase OafA/YrhL
VLTHVYGSRFAKERNWRAIGAFLWARFCRVYPASLFTTAVLLLAIAVGSMQVATSFSFVAQLTANLLLMQVPWLDAVIINQPSWSISAEFYAYLLFPFLVPIIIRLPSRTALVLGIVLLLEIAVFHTILDSQISGWGALTRSLPEFTAGVFAYRFYRERLFRTIWEKGTTLIVIIAMITGVGFAGVLDGLVVPLLWALLLGAVCNSGRMRLVINARPLRWLGDISYSVYIFQTAAFSLAAGMSGQLVAHGFGGIRYEAVVVFLATASGVLVHRCVDVPARAALRRLPAQMRSAWRSDTGPRAFRGCFLRCARPFPAGPRQRTAPHLQHSQTRPRSHRQCSLRSGPCIPRPSD